jgi:hypothetical protein
MSETTLGKFNRTVVSFIEDLKKIFGENDADILAMEGMCDVVKLNARIIIVPFQQYILDNPVFVKNITDQNINFFLDCTFDTMRKENQQMGGYINKLISKFKEATRKHRDDKNTMDSIFNWFKVMVYFAFLDRGNDPISQIKSICQTVA